MSDMTIELLLKFIPIIAVLGMVYFMLTGFSTKLKLPATEPDMTKVYLIKYFTWGHHSLAFYNDGSLTEFTFGDWELFALNKRDPWTAFKNMTFLTPGCMGRKSTAWNPGDTIYDKFKDCEMAVSFFAPADKVLKLHNKLQNSYDANSETEYYNQQERVYFVKYDVPYWLFHNCNHELADWLELIGADVSGRVFYKPDFIGGMAPKQEPIQ
jgi:hypothetical protein